MQWKDTQDGSALHCRVPGSQPLELPVKLSCRKSPWRKIITDQNRHLGLLLGWEPCPFPPISMRCEEMWSLQAPGVGLGASSHHHRKMGKRFPLQKSHSVNPAAPFLHQGHLCGCIYNHSFIFTILRQQSPNPKCRALLSAKIQNAHFEFSAEINTKPSVRQGLPQTCPLFHGIPD